MLKRAFPKSLGLCYFDHASMLEKCHLFRVGYKPGQIVADDQHAHLVTRKPGQQIEDAVCKLRVQTECRFIGYQKRRACGQGGGDQGAFGHSA